MVSRINRSTAKISTNFSFYCQGRLREGHRKARVLPHPVPVPVRLRGRPEQDGALPLPNARLRVRLQNVRDIVFVSSLSYVTKRVGHAPLQRNPVYLSITFTPTHRYSAALHYVSMRQTPNGYIRIQSYHVPNRTNKLVFFFFAFLSARRWTGAQHYCSDFIHAATEAYDSHVHRRTSVSATLPCALCPPPGKAQLRNVDLQPLFVHKISTTFASR